jgi:subtilase family serine protease
LKYSSVPLCVAIGAFCGILTAGNAFALERLQPTTRAAAGQMVEFNVYLPLRHTHQLDQLLAAQQDPKSPNYHKWLTPGAFRARFGANPVDIERVTRTLESYGLNVTSTNSEGVRVQGRAASIENTFGMHLWNGRTSSGRTGLMARGTIAMPSVLAESGAMIAQFSPIVWHHVHVHKVAGVAQAEPQNRYGGFGPYWFDDLKQAYDFPSARALCGRGATIGILMSSDYSPRDMQLYFGHEKINPPKIVRRRVHGGASFDPTKNDASYEVELDIQQAGGMAPGATIVLYNIPDLGDDSILSGYLDIVEDNVVDVVSSSFGGPELGYTAEYNDGVDYSWILKIYDQIFKQGNAQGITFVASSGDEGGLGIPSLDYFTTPPQKPAVVVGHFVPSVETPASSPYVTAVGGTNLATTFDPSSESLESKYVGENADGDPLAPFDPYGTGNLAEGGYWGSGGGKSIFFRKPVYQRLVNTNSQWRTVPDVSMQMGGCPVGTLGPCSPDRSYVLAVVGGQLVGLVGTSASAPELAGLLALEVEHLGGRLGNVNYDIYAQAARQYSGATQHRVFHDRIPGFNGIYHSNGGYDYVTGNGSVFGKYFIHAPNVPSAGDPQSGTNP